MREWERGGCWSRKPVNKRKKSWSGAEINNHQTRSRSPALEGVFSHLFHLCMSPFHSFITSNSNIRVIHSKYKEQNRMSLCFLLCENCISSVTVAFYSIFVYFTKSSWFFRWSGNANRNAQNGLLVPSFLHLVLKFLELFGTLRRFLNYWNYSNPLSLSLSFFCFLSFTLSLSN